jgi:hypothetical protein
MTKSEAIAKSKLLDVVKERLLSIGIRPSGSLAGGNYFSTLALEVMQGDIVIVSRKKTTKSPSGVKFEILVKGRQ